VLILLFSNASKTTMVLCCLTLSVPGGSSVAICTVTGCFTFKYPKCHYLVELSNTITCQPIELRSCSNPLRIQKVLVLTEKFFVHFGFGVLFGWCHNGGMFLHFTALDWLASIWSQNYGSKTKNCKKFYPANANLRCIPPQAILISQLS